MEEETSVAGVINWYPGHIARAERELRAYLKRVDVVIEARDARIGATTAHPDARRAGAPVLPSRVAAGSREPGHARVDGLRGRPT